MKNVVTVSEVSHPKCTHACLYPGEDGRRKRKYFTNETDALDFANKRREELGINGSAFGTINADERAHAEAKLAEFIKTYEKGAPKLATWAEQNIPEGLTVFGFPEASRQRLRTSNMCETLNSQIKCGK
jgi:hypothetical protein